MLDNNLQNQRLIDQARSVNKNYDFNVFLKSLIALSIAFKGYTARVMWYHNHIVKMRAWANGSSDQLTEMIEKINKLRNQSWLRKLIKWINYIRISTREHSLVLILIYSFKPLY